MASNNSEKDKSTKDVTIEMVIASDGKATKKEEKSEHGTLRLNQMTEIELLSQVSKLNSDTPFSPRVRRSKQIDGLEHPLNNPRILNTLQRILAKAPEELRRDAQNVFMAVKPTKAPKVVRWLMRFDVWSYFLSFLIGAILLILGLIFKGFDFGVERQADNVSLYQWLIWLGVVLLVPPLVRLFFAVVSYFIKRGLGMNAFLVEGLSDAISGAVAAIVWLSITRPMLPGQAAYSADMLRKAEVALVVITVLRLAKRFLDNYLSVKLQGADFFDRISKINLKGKTLKALLRGGTRRPLDVESKAGIVRIWQRLLRTPVIKESDEESLTITDRRLLLEAVLTVERVYQVLGIEGRADIPRNALRKVFADDAEVKYALSLYDMDQNNVIEYHELLTSIFEFYKDRQNLFRDLHDRNQASQLLSRILGLVFWAVMLVITLSIFGINVGDYVTAYITTALGFVFIFGNSLRDLWESCVFIFYVRPFDVGDYFRLSLDPPTYIVHRIRMLVTECFTNDGRYVVMPNPKLYTSMIYSYKRSKNACVSCTVSVSHKTTKDQISNLTENVMRWMRDSKQPFIWEELFVWIDKIEDSNRMNIGFWCECNGVNWQGSWLKCQSEMLLAVQNGCIQLGLNYTKPTQPVRLVPGEGPAASPTETKKDK